MPNFTAIATLLALVFYFYTSLAVGMARTKFGVKAPAVTGHPQFERLFRAQMNTLEWMPIFLPALWLFALYVNDRVAALLGLLWIIARLLYFRGYTAEAEKRATGFGLQTLVVGVLFLGALGGAVSRLLAS